MAKDLINNEKGLATVCADLEKEPVIAIDTECVREETYYPIPALLQIASYNDVFAIDLSTISDFSALHDLFSNPNITKIIHSGKQDYQIFQMMKCSLTMPVFDTQIAAAFLALGQQISYKDLIEQCLGVILDKSCTRSNWLQRPLSDTQYQYAISDVTYLVQAYDILKKQLIENDKLDWAMEENEYTLEEYQYALNLHPEKMKIKVTGKNAITSQSDDRKLQLLTAWREQKARLANLPRRWLLPDNALVSLATIQNVSNDNIQPLLKKCPAKHLQNWQQEISQLLNSVEDNNRPIKREMPSTSQQRRIDKMIKNIKKLSTQCHIDSILIGNRKEITQWVMHNDKRIHHKLTQSWRKHILADLLTPNE